MKIIQIKKINNENNLNKKIINEKNLNKKTNNANKANKKLSNNADKIFDDILLDIENTVKSI